MAAAAPAELERIVSEAAAKPMGCEDPEEILVELEEQYLTEDGRRSIVVSWAHSLKCAPESRDAAKQAVIDALPAGYRGYHVQFV
ncbi:MAG TPA: hypothetical protein VJV79_04060 [Polyangiaceae bacterium]|nr:hypothetical protein [Polyangiaceae bacterium]